LALASLREYCKRKYTLRQIFLIGKLLIFPVVVLSINIYVVYFVLSTPPENLFKKFGISLSIIVLYGCLISLFTFSPETQDEVDSYRIERENITIICPECLKSILTSSIKIVCPFCPSILQGKHIYTYCWQCKRKLPAIECPHCQGMIDLFAKYNLAELERKTYEKI
jgi:hypothetical protein